MSTHQNLHYRLDIDGLRAWAVLSVVIYHFFPHILPGGFIGVDVFFVISGFLIARIILQQFNENRFSFVDFYARRIRRIFPALFVVLSITFLYGAGVLFEKEFQHLSKHILGGAGFAANFVLLSESGYFDTDSAQKPLLHLWSLGIEEQFYIVFPCVLFWAHKKHWRLLTLMAFLFLISFVTNHNNVERNPIGTFYSPFTRIWELLAGAMLANIMLNYAHWSHKIILKMNAGIHFLFLEEQKPYFLNHCFSCLGFLFLILGFFLLNEKSAFPGDAALLPVLGSVFLIVSGENAKINVLLLKNRLAVFIGKISYPLYLWHWPILVFLKIYWGETPPAWVLLVFILFAIVLSFLTTHLIENPLRFGKNRRLKVVVLVFLMAILASLALFVFLQDPKDERSGYVVDEKYITKKGKMGDEWSYYGNRSAKQKIVLFGDSHMQHLSGQIVEKLGNDFAIDSIALGGCHVGKSFLKNIDPQNLPWCEKMQQEMRNLPQVDVVLSSNLMHIYDNYPWNEEDFYKLMMDKLNLLENPPKRWIFIGSPGEVNFQCETFNRRRFKHHSKECAPMGSKVYKDYILFSQNLMAQKRFPPYVEFIYPFLDLCDENGKCQFENENGIKNYLNGDHLNYAGGEKTALQLRKMLLNQ